MSAPRLSYTGAVSASIKESLVSESTSMLPIG